MANNFKLLMTRLLVGDLYALGSGIIGVLIGLMFWILLILG